MVIGYCLLAIGYCRNLRANIIHFSDTVLKKQEIRRKLFQIVLIIAEL